jgi:hypothetical protein
MTTYDPYWGNVKYMLNFNGPAGGKRLVDEKHNLWVGGSTLTYSTVQKLYGLTSLFFDGTSTGTIPASVTIAPATQATIELWMFPTVQAVATPVVLDLGFRLKYSPSTAPGKFVLQLSGVDVLTSTNTFAVDAWYHVAITKNGTTYNLFVNGQLEGSVISASPINITGSAAVGNQSGTGSYFRGFMAGFRYTIEINRYPSNFTPVMGPFPGGEFYDADYDKVMLHTHCNGEESGVVLVDQKNHTLTRVGNPVTTIADGKFGASCLSNVENAYFEAAYSQDFNLGAGDFTIEMWVKSTATYNNATSYGFLRLVQQGAANRVVNIGFTSFSVYVTLLLPHLTTDTSIFVSGSLAVGTAWAFISLTRLGSTLYLHVNGILAATKTIGVDCSLTNAAYAARIGGQGAAANVDEVRFTKGMGRYTSSNYTPPTEPFPDFTIQKLSGTVRDPNGNPISRRVRSYRKSDGILIDTGVSDPTTGAFTLRATDVSEHFVVVHDDEKNALIYDHIVPVV